MIGSIFLVTCGNLGYEQCYIQKCSAVKALVFRFSFSEMECGNVVIE